MIAASAPATRELFRKLVGGFPAGVTIVTTRDASGTPWGFTASSFASLSLSPPLVLVCLEAAADCHPAFSVSEGMTINILGVGQGEVAMRFASKGADKFAGVATTPGAHTSLPLIDGALVHIECRMHARHVAGDHTILVGEVLGGVRGEGEPLVYFGRGFGHFKAE